MATPAESKNPAGDFMKKYQTEIIVIGGGALVTGLVGLGVITWLKPIALLSQAERQSTCAAKYKLGFGTTITSFIVIAILAAIVIGGGDYYFTQRQKKKDLKQ